MRCELCGKPESKIRALIEGVQMNTCEDCAKFGKTLARTAENTKTTQQKTQIKHSEEPQETLIENYGQQIKNAREKLKITQHEFSTKYNIKESLLHNIETNKGGLDIETAKKLQKQLNIKIIEIEENRTIKENTDEKNKKEGPLTIGDLLKR